MGRHRAGSAPERAETTAPAARTRQEQAVDDVGTAVVERLEMRADPSVFRVLFVCTGNLHRSVMGERLMKSRIRPDLPIAIRSAGTQAAVDFPIGEFSAIALKELGADPEGHTPQQLVPAFAASADLILTAELEHRQLVLVETPAALRRVFSMREFARLAEQVEPLKGSATYDVEALRAHVLEVSAQRGVAKRATRSEDIADPVRASLKETRERAHEIAECVDAVIESLGLGPL